MTTSSTRRPRSRRLLFVLVLVVVIPAMILLVAEVAVRLCGVAAPVDPYLALDSRLSILQRVERNGRAFYRVEHPDVSRAEGGEFPVEKPPGTVRVFCLGGSAAKGWPHPESETYPVYLQAMLERALPDVSLEVHNVAGHGYASYRVRMIAEEVLECDPDLLVVMSGNNEFVEDRAYAGGGFVPAVRWVAARSRLVQWLHGMTRAALRGESMDLRAAAIHMMLHLRELSSRLRTDPVQLAHVREHYAWSIDWIARAAGARGVPVLLMTVPTNLRDWEPNSSVEALAGEARARWEQRRRAGRAALLTERPRAACDALAVAAALHPGHADTLYELARALEAAGLGEALEAYRRAKDLDGNPFRALTVFQEALRAIAAEHEHVYLLDLERLFERKARYAAPGWDLFLDYVHPSKRGNLAIAEAVAVRLLADGIGGLAPRGTPLPRDAVFDPSPGYTDETDWLMQWQRLQLCTTMHQYRVYVSIADRLLAASAAGEVPDDAVALMPLELAATLRDAFARFLAEQRRDLLGEPHDPDYRAKHERVYRALFPQQFADVLK